MGKAFPFFNEGTYIVKFSHNVIISLAMGPGHNFLTRVGPGQPSLVWVCKISSNNTNFLFFSLLVRKNWGLGQRQVSLLFTAGQKYARVGSVPISMYHAVNICSSPLFSLYDILTFSTLKSFQTRLQLVVLNSYLKWFIQTGCCIGFPISVTSLQEVWSIS